MEGWEYWLRHRHAETGAKQRLIREFRYQAKSWNLERRLITRLEYGTQGPNFRFIVTGGSSDCPIEKFTRFG